MAPSTAGGSGRKTARIAMLSTLSLVILYGSSAVPLGQLGLVALAGLVPAASIVSSGSVRAGLFCYVVTGCLGLLVVPNKGNIILYLLFFGLYPVIKSLAECRSARVMSFVYKQAFFNVALSVIWFGMRQILLPFLPVELEHTGLIYLVGNLIFPIYDIGFSQVIMFYTRRIDCILRK